MEGAFGGSEPYLRTLAYVANPLSALVDFANGKPGHFRTLSDMRETEGHTRAVIASLGFGASRCANSSSDPKRAKGFEPSTFSLGSTFPRPA